MSNRIKHRGVSRRYEIDLLPGNDRVRARIVKAAAEVLGAIQIGRRLWHVDGSHLGTTRMVALAQVRARRSA